MLVRKLCKKLASFCYCNSGSLPDLYVIGCMWLSTKKPQSSSCHYCNYFQYSGTEYIICNNISQKFEVIYKKSTILHVILDVSPTLSKMPLSLHIGFSNMLLVTPKNFYISRMEPVESYLKIPNDIKIISYFCVSSLLYPRRIVCLLKTLWLYLYTGIISSLYE